MEITARQISLSQEQNEVFIDLEMIEDIHRIFMEINRLKKQLADVSSLKGDYSTAVNELYEITIENSWIGEWMSQRALELGASIRASLVAHKKIKELEAELAEKYGFLYEYKKAACDRGCQA
ncbi:MAG: hypothetical protein GXY34_07060 [Syntrophomonadaceae bacterium]|nr:hypothetical protein [Syntrophomonadaceae bacterium]